MTKTGTPPHQLIHGLLDKDLRYTYIYCGLVQDQQLPVGEQSPGNGEQLLLATRDSDVVLPDNRVI